MFTVDQIISQYYPDLLQSPWHGPLTVILRWLLHEKAFIEFAEEYPHLHGIEFIEQVLEHFHFGYQVSNRQRENIPVCGRVVLIANHPIGSLDGLALIKLVHEVRSDVRIVANELLAALNPLKPFLLPVRNMGGRSRQSQIKPILEALSREQAVIIFPAGEVSRFGFRGVRDGKWHKGFVKIAERARAPILPVRLNGRNSLAFCLASCIAKPLSTLMLVNEMFHQRDKQLEINIGRLIPYGSYGGLKISSGEKSRLLRKQVYRLGTMKKPLFAGEAPIAAPERRTDLRRAVQQGELLGRTPDGKTIYLFDPDDSSPVMREIGRLREVAFRAVGEGTGRRRDLDRFDLFYRHLILWDEEDLEIAGAYRFADAAKIVAQQGIGDLYSASLFRLDQQECSFLRDGLELGRSFVQPRYWNRRSLDYLWYGIGAFLARNSQYRYLFGPVSISDAMPPMARELLVYFYKLYFSDSGQASWSRNPFSFSQPLESLKREFSGTDYRADFTRLKALMANLGTAIPPLYKQYTELCEPGGVVFLDFNVDHSFANCVDGLVIVDTCRLKEQKRRRYMEESLLECVS